mmetsp:Transcript_18081/g.57777  ORF Transcript_18081/g.57777 Transcript_18081/m.57777 type:complete len:368 (-) Transcript_18081:459-1562(-)
MLSWVEELDGSGGACAARKAAHLLAWPHRDSGESLGVCMQPVDHVLESTMRGVDPDVEATGNEAGQVAGSAELDARVHGRAASTEAVCAAVSQRPLEEALDKAVHKVCTLAANVKLNEGHELAGPGGQNHSVKDVEHELEKHFGDPPAASELLVTIVEDQQEDLVELFSDFLCASAVAKEEAFLPRVLIQVHAVALVVVSAVLHRENFPTALLHWCKVVQADLRVHEEQAVDNERQHTVTKDRDVVADTQSLADIGRLAIERLAGARKLSDQDRQEGAAPKRDDAQHRLDRKVDSVGPRSQGFSIFLVRAIILGRFDLVFLLVALRVGVTKREEVGDEQLEHGLKEACVGRDQPAQDAFMRSRDVVA